MSFTPQTKCRLQIKEENPEATALKRIENMKIHAKNFGEKSAWMDHPKYKNQFQEILKELQDKESSSMKTSSLN